MDLAVLSKALATIKIDCDLDFDYEQARIGNLYTKEAYELFKRLEFKNMISRFQFEEEEPVKSCEIHLVNDFGEAQDIFAQAKKAETLGFQILADKEFAGRVKAVTLPFIRTFTS